MVMNEIHDVYMTRCLELAAQSLGNVAPNPMVGSVIVLDGKIIGEGYHQYYGSAHAEVNAIHNVIDKELLKKATLYVNLEPCSHFGKTPPCADLIIRSHIPYVVIGTLDTNSLVAGKGVEKLVKAGIDVKIGIKEDECKQLNKRFFTFHQFKRPYIILKWAQTQDGFIDHIRKNITDGEALKITNSQSQQLVHRWRAEEQAIMVGTTTALLDNPSLTVRDAEGRNPLRIAIDKLLQIPATHHLLDSSTPTLIFTSRPSATSPNLEYVQINFEHNIIPQICDELYRRNIQSIIVEGGEKLLNSFIENNLWDEARVFTSTQIIELGVKAPLLTSSPFQTTDINGDQLLYFRN